MKGIMKILCFYPLFVAAALGATSTVQVVNNDFTPDPVMINLGDTVNWVWASGGTQHSSTAAPGQSESWDSDLRTQPFSFNHMFTHTGTFSYYCTLHGFTNTDGTVGVNGMSGHVLVAGETSLSLLKIATPDPGAVGGNTTYTLSVTNSSSGDLSEISLTDLVPTGVVFVSTTPSQRSCTQITGTVSCELGTLADGESADVTIIVSNIAAGRICNAATVTASTVESTILSNSASVCTDVAVHDLAVISIKAPKTLTLTGTKTNQTKFVRVTIQNRSPHSETIQDLGVLSNLVTLTVQSLDTNQCPDPPAVLLTGPPQRPLPVTLKPKQKFTVI
jgi:uncharacterized repeat protein (TIGR01451 family)